MGWLLTRQGGIQAFAGYGIGGIIIALAAAHFLRGRMTIEGGPSGQTIERFKSFERFGHWCLAGSFIMLVYGAITVVWSLGHIPVLDMKPIQQLQRSRFGYTTILPGSLWRH